METTKTDKNLFNKIIEMISGIFIPIINYLMAAALIKGLLVLAVNMKWISETEGTYRLLYAVSDGFFYFLPIFLAISASKILKADTFTSVMIAAALVYPKVTEIFQNGTGTAFLGLHVRPVIYPSSVIPVLLAIGFLHYVEIPLEKYLPAIVKGFLKPMISLLIVAPITFLIFGPVGNIVSDFLAKAFSSAYDYNPILAGVIFGFIWQMIVVFGLHWGIVPVVISNINTFGVDHILPLLGPAVMGQAGAAMAVSFMVRNKKRKAQAVSCSVTAILGVTEPTLYGITVPLRRPMIAACLAGAVGGGIVGTSHAGAVAFAFPSFLSLVVYLGKGFWTYFLALIIAFIIGFLLALLFGLKESDKTKE